MAANRLSVGVASKALSVVVCGLLEFWGVEFFLGLKYRLRRPRLLSAVRVAVGLDSL